MNMKKEYWINRKAKIELEKDNKRLIFTALILEYDSNLITFRDREGKVYSFNTELIKQIWEA